MKITWGNNHQFFTKWSRNHEQFPGPLYKLRIRAALHTSQNCCKTIKWVNESVSWPQEGRAWTVWESKGAASEAPGAGTTCCLQPGVVPAPPGQLHVLHDGCIHTNPNALHQPAQERLQMSKTAVTALDSSLCSTAQWKTFSECFCVTIDKISISPFPASQGCSEDKGTRLYELHCPTQTAGVAMVIEN